jgi:hypothetical protein
LNNTGNTGGNIRGSFIAVLDELVNNNIVNRIVAQGQLVGTATNTNINLSSSNVFANATNGDNIANFSIFLTGTNNTQVTLGISFSNLTNSSIESFVSGNTNNVTLPGTSTLSGGNVGFTRITTTTATVNYNYTITVTLT